MALFLLGATVYFKRCMSLAPPFLKFEFYHMQFVCASFVHVCAGNAIVCALTLKEIFKKIKGGAVDMRAPPFLKYDFFLA